MQPLDLGEGGFGKGREMLFLLASHLQHLDVPWGKRIAALPPIWLLSEQKGRGHRESPLVTSISLEGPGRAGRAR